MNSNVLESGPFKNEKQLASSRIEIPGKARSLCLIGLIRLQGGGLGRFRRILGECIPMQVLASSFEFLFGELAAILHLSEGVEAED